MKLYNHHLSKIATYGLIALISIFIIGASFWYKKQFFQSLVSKEVILVEPILTKENRIKEKTVTYAIDVTYPIFSQGSDAVLDVNSFLTSLYSGRVKDFKKQAQESYKNAPEELLKGSDTASYYTTSFQEVASTSRYISLVVSNESYYIGMAHPAHDIDTFILDKKTKKLMQVSELFTTTSTYEKILSERSKFFFTARNKKEGVDGLIIDTSQANDGFTATTSNFSKVLPTDDGLVVYFTEYQIAPYVAGQQQALLQYDAFKDIINEDGVLGEYK